jgi:hypothetical protein
MSIEHKYLDIKKKYIDLKKNSRINKLWNGSTKTSTNTVIN